MCEQSNRESSRLSKCAAAPLSNVSSVHRSYTEDDSEGREAGRQQTEGHPKVVDEAILHRTVRCLLDEGAAVISADPHHAVTLDAQNTIYGTPQPSKSCTYPFKSSKSNTKRRFCLHQESK